MDWAHEHMRFAFRAIELQVGQGRSRGEGLSGRKASLTPPLPPKERMRLEAHRYSLYSDPDKLCPQCLSADMPSS